MKKNGFTLSEILGVVIILGVLMLLVTVPKYFNSIKLNDTKQGLILSAVDNYIEKYKSAYTPHNNSIYYISMKQLTDSKFLDKKILTSDLGNKYSEDDYVELTGNGESFDINISKSDEDTLMDIISDQEIIEFANNKLFDSNSKKVYVNFNGMLWRVIGYNADGSVKLILNDNITAIIPNDGSSSYEDSYVRKWLNEEFYSKINRNDLIVDGTYCGDTASSSTATNSSCNNELQDKIGLLSLFEVNSGMSLGMVSTDVNHLLTTLDNSHHAYILKSDKTIDISNSIIPIYIKPVINVYGDALVFKVSGESENIYTINEELEECDCNTNEISLEIGKYVKFEDSNHVFRIQESSDEYIKLISNSSILHSAYSANNDDFNLNTGIGYELNNDVYENLGFNEKTYDKILKNMIYTSDNSLDYKVYQKDKYLIENAYLGLPRIGDLFLTPKSLTTTQISSLQVYWVGIGNILYYNKKVESDNKIIMYVKNDFFIESGLGVSASNPYLLKAT